MTVGIMNVGHASRHAFTSVGSGDRLTGISRPIMTTPSIRCGAIRFQLATGFMSTVSMQPLDFRLADGQQTVRDMRNPCFC